MRYRLENSNVKWFTATVYNFVWVKKPESGCEKTAITSRALYKFHLLQSMEVVDSDGEVCFEHGYAVKDVDDSSWKSLFGMLSMISNRIAYIRMLLVDIDKRIKECEEEQDTRTSIIRSKIQLYKSKVDMLRHMLDTTEIEAVAPPITALIKPAKRKEDLDELEDKAKDKQYSTLITQAVGRLLGFNRQGEGASVCHQIVDYFFDRQFLIECSWSGESRHLGRPYRGIRKIALSSYKHVIELFHACVCVSDDTFTQNQCVKFLRLCLQYSTIRVKAKRKRKPVARRCKPKKNPTSEDLAVKVLVENQLQRLQTVAGNITLNTT
ncbi:uncharacterized protein LOC118456740 isoform X1 [Anopheles albimanus]|nr:uncharacterized protein LOC118456740 isoform X1 [Anopheles albimanus]XP_035773683.1 uncharacterized protein LOC118456740 isoform X1 [Anopheles albimanus]